MSIQDVCWALKQDIQNPGAKLVLVSIANHLHSKMDYAFPSIESVAEEASMSARSVRRHLKWLEAEEYLLVENNYTSNGRQTSNRYWLNLDRQNGGKGRVSDCHPPVNSERTNEGGGCQIVRGEGDTAVTPEGDTAVTPLTGIITGIRKNPLTPEDGGGAARADWEKLCEGWRLAAGDSFERAKRPWNKLDGLEMGLALKHAKAFQAKWPKAHLVTYLRQKRWQGFEQAGQSKSGGMVFIAKGSPEWDAWCAHEGKSTLSCHFDKAHKKEGRYERTRFPTKAINGTKNQLDGLSQAAS